MNAIPMIGLCGSCSDASVTLHEIHSEAHEASMRYGPFTSTHEAYGVLAEECAELLEAIRSNDLEAVRREAIQVSAVAMRLALYCRDNPAFATRSGA
jgi:NTP pyrophosphatase (non-canonical NTP hydrolase)